MIANAQSQCSNIFLTTQQAKTESIKGAQFLLQRKQPDHTAFQVERAVQIEKQQQKVTISKPVEKIQVWLKRYEGWLKKYQADPKAHDFLLQSFYKEYVVKKEEIPENFYDLQARIARESGHGDIVLNEQNKEHLARVAIADQKASLKAWVDYLFFSKETESIPMWAKMWSFSGMVKLGKYDPETGSFSLRSKGQAAPFPSLDKEVFRITVEFVIKKINGESLQDITDSVLRSQLEGANFGKLYGRGLLLKMNHKLETLDVKGEWIKYEKGSDPNPLVKSLSGKNTGWCTDGLSTAKEQLSGGDFYVFYSMDSQGAATDPRIAIRMEGSRIGEIRGIGTEQNLDRTILKTKILDDKLKEFGSEGELYTKRTEHMKLLTLIEQKHNKNIPLSKEELTFLYEINDKIEGFGQKEDPRIKEIISQRNNRQDLAFVFDISEDEISVTKEEALNKKIKIHFGDLHFGYNTSAQGLEFPKIVFGDIYLNNLESLQGLKLPEITTGNIYLGSFENAQEIDFRSLKRCGGLYFYRLKTAQGLKLPNVFNGDLDIGLQTVQNFQFPEVVNGDLKLRHLRSAQNIKLPKVVKGDLYLDALESVRGLEFPEEISGDIFLSESTLRRDIKIPKDYNGIIFIGVRVPGGTNKYSVVQGKIVNDKASFGNKLLEYGFFLISKIQK